MAFRPPTQAQSLLSGLRCARTSSSISAFPLRAGSSQRGSVNPLFPSRSFASSALRCGIFSRSTTPSDTTSSSSSPQAVPAQAIATPDDVPPTAFQSRIAELEVAATASPESLSAQIQLLRALAEGGEYKGLAGWYDHVALASSAGQGGAGEVQSKALLSSEEAWGMYMSALAQSGRLGEVAGRVRKRDELLRSAGLAATATTHGATSPSLAAAAAAPATAIGPTSSATTSTATPSNPAPAPATSFLSRLLGSKSTSTPSDSASGTAPTPIAIAGTTAPTTGAAASGNVGVGAGTPLSPLYVQIAPPTPQANTFKAFRWLLGMAFWAFLILTVLSLVAENTGLLKAGSQPMEFEPEEGKVVKFDDVHGCEEAKTELEEIVEFLRNPEKFSALGGKLPKGVLLTGPPGTGKTLLARAVAGEAGVPFLFASGSSFDEMFVGVGAKRVRELFGAARKKAPAIIFIDELDAIGSKRSAKDAHYMKQTLNQLLVELDGFEQVEGVIIIAATNFPESLDKALTRPGRFDRHVTVGLPDVRGRIAILKHHMTDIAYDTDVDASVIARGCPGMSGADLQNLVNQAAVKASRDGQSSVQLKHFEWAKDRILMGAERKSHYVTEESKKSTAYHEGGHALVAMHTPGAMPLHKVTIMPRGPALGITFQLPEQDKDSYSRKEYSAMIDVALGGRAAEEMIYGYDDVTSGCSSDLVRATDVATRMIRSFGFSDKVGLVAHGDEESVYLSSKKKDEIEGEIRQFLDNGMERVKRLLKENEHELHTLANALVEYETLSLDEVRQVLRGEKLDRPSASEGLKLVGEHERKPEGPIVEGI